MDLISIETAEENRMVQDLMMKHDLYDIWTSGRLCNFHGCDQPHLQPRHINGEENLQFNEGPRPSIFELDLPLSDIC